MGTAENPVDGQEAAADLDELFEFLLAVRADGRDIGPDKLKFAMMNFYSDHGAYDGPPPTP